MVKKDWSQYRLVALLPFLLVVIVYATEAFSRNSFYACGNRNCRESIPANIWKVLKIDTGTAGESTSDRSASDIARQVTGLRYSGRMTWYFLAEIFLYVSLACLGIAAVIVALLFPPLRIPWALGVLAAAALVGRFFFRHPEIHMAIFQTIFREAITVDVPAIAQWTNLLNSLGNAAVFALLLAICATLLPFDDPSFAGGLQQLSTRMNYLRLILYAGTALLVTAILLKKAIYQWTLAYTPQQDYMLKTAQDFVTSLLTLEGGFYTLVLAAAYFPAALVLQRRAQILVGLSPGGMRQDRKLRLYGLNISLKESLPRILAVLGPLLTGPIADFLTSSFF